MYCNGNTILRSLPKINAYAYLLKKRLVLENFKYILRVWFSKDICYSFRPDVLENKVLDFINEINLKRETPLYSKKQKRNLAGQLSKDSDNFLS